MIPSCQAGDHHAIATATRGQIPRGSARVLNDRSAGDDRRALPCTPVGPRIDPTRPVPARSPPPRGLRGHREVHCWAASKRAVTEDGWTPSGFLPWRQAGGMEALLPPAGFGRLRPARRRRMGEMASRLAAGRSRRPLSERLLPKVKAPLGPA